MKVKLKAFKYNVTLKKEFSNVDDAQRFAELMASRFPDMIFEPYIESGNSKIIDTSNSKEEGSTLLLKN